MGDVPVVTQGKGFLRFQALVLVWGWLDLNAMGWWRGNQRGCSWEEAAGV